MNRRQLLRAAAITAAAPAAMAAPAAAEPVMTALDREELVSWLLADFEPQMVRGLQRMIARFEADRAQPLPPLMIPRALAEEAEALLTRTEDSQDV